MPKVESGTPKMLRPYEFHGVHLEWEEGKEEATGDCPWCGREGKFSVLIETGQWRCFVCNEGVDNGKVNKGGNAFTFIRMLWEQSLESTTDYSNLRIHRKLLTDESLRSWGVCKAVLGYSNWLIPGFNAEGKLTQLYRYIKDKMSGKFRLIPTPELGHGLHGMNLFNSDKKEVYLGEGPWDGMAWWEALAGTKRIDGGKLAITASIENSLLQEANVLATPGCNVFNEGWINLFARKHVYLMYDNDHSKLNRGKLVESAGYAGMRRVAQLLSRADEPPETIRFLKWGDNGFDRALPTGYDVRDCLAQGATQSQRVTFVQQIINKIQPIPEDWIEGRSKSTAKKGGTEMESVPCETWAELVVEWRKALRWTEGLDRALSIMLACVTSTKAIGDQLWIKIIGPPACLHGDTPIYDPIDGSFKPVRMRAEEDRGFHVYSKCHETDEVIVAHALCPRLIGRAEMFKVSFANGNSLTVAEKHRFLTPTMGYVELTELSVGDLVVAFNEGDIKTGASNLPYNTNITLVEGVGESNYYDFHVPVTNNYWTSSVFNHNCGKSTLCEALSINRDFTIAKSTIRGFHSGYKTDKEGEEDHSLIPLIMGKTLITKDGDTLLQSPNLAQILSEARDLYDSVSRTHYRHGMNRDYDGVRMTWILCGTSSLRSIDSSELGERFLDCVIMDRIEEDLEDEILIRKANQSKRCLSFEADGKIETQHDPDLVRAMQLTGGYIDYLRKNARRLMDEVDMSDEAMTTCIHYAKFVAHLRARPSKKQDETAEREFATRLTSQIVRLATCVAVVLNRKTVDVEVLRRVKRVTMDTARGRTMEICRHLFRAGEIGLDTKALAMYTNQTEDSERTLLRFLRKIEVVDSFVIKSPGVSQRPRWKLTQRMKKLYTEVCVEE